ncbi:Ankyrin repeat protein 1 [Giardia duodenalis]|uniref:Ankyrin repeat protein 1 n=1 Tax=Giardia intestinalis (strain ATCC 50803 / WB clone C6) TaxID=184922 RepID=A8BHX8_GIAIC|nr:Ankyrin repeat protein 1 [Giardia intestinalis]KAE8302617.1 Ankyrin repeat protein 1 [Giardia intestinalis]|eukprot:XP_001706941.1 Protein 21.1 [Giardia lamblia ATCC 50803]
MAENWFDAARQGQFNRLCSLSASCIKSRDSSGNTALMLVVQSGHTECLKLLEEEATMTNNSGLTALAIAIMCGNNTACAFLAPMEAHIVLPSKLSMLMLAAKLGNCDAVNCVVPYAQEETSTCSETALGLAVQGNHLECVRTLLNRMPYTVSDIYTVLSTSNTDIKVLLLERCDSLLEYDMSASRKSIEHVPFLREQYDQRIAFLKDIIYCLKMRSQEQSNPYNTATDCIDMSQLHELNRHIKDCHAYIQTLKCDFSKLQQDKKSMQDGYEEKLQRMQKIYASSIGSLQAKLHTKDLSSFHTSDSTRECSKVNTVSHESVTQTSQSFLVEGTTQTESHSCREIAIGDVHGPVGAVSWGGGPAFLAEAAPFHSQFMDACIQTSPLERSLSSDVPRSDLSEADHVSPDASLAQDDSSLQQQLLEKTAEVQALSNELAIMQSTIEHIFVTQSRELSAKDLELEQEIEIFTERISTLSEDNLRLEKQNRTLQEENTLLSERIKKVENTNEDSSAIPADSVTRLPSPSVNDDLGIAFPHRDEAGIQTDPSYCLVSVKIGDDRAITEPLLPLQQAWLVIPGQRKSPADSLTPLPVLDVTHRSCQSCMDTNEACCQAVVIDNTTVALRQEIELACQQVEEFTDRRASRTSMFVESAEKMLSTEDPGEVITCNQSDDSALVYRIEKLEQALRDKDAELSLANDKIARLETIETKCTTHSHSKKDEAALVLPSSQARSDTECAQLLSAVCVPSPQANLLSISPSSIEEENRELRNQVESLRRRMIQLTHSSRKSIAPIIMASNTLTSASSKLCQLAQRLKELLDNPHNTAPKVDDKTLSFIEELTTEILEYSTSIQSALQDSAAAGPMQTPSVHQDLLLSDAVTLSQDSTNTDLMEAAILDNVDVASLFLNQVGRRNVDGETALMIAAKHNSLEVAKLLAQHEANCVRKDGMTALAIALYNKNLDMAMLLSDYEGPSNNLTSDSPGSTARPIDALILAARHNDVISTWTLLKTHARYQDDQGRTALMHAAEHGFDIIVHLLAGSEAGMQDVDGYTGLMIAANLGYTLVVTELRNCEAGMQCARGYTALMYAAAAGHKAAVAALAPFEAGIQTSVSKRNTTTSPTTGYSADEISDTTGITALMLAVEAGSVDCVNVLWPLEHHITDAQGMAAIHYACSEPMRNLLRSYQ